jgi:peptidoglycan hydrolase CwlO-like protein
LDRHYQDFSTPRLEKIDKRIESLNTKIDSLRTAFHPEIHRVDEKIDSIKEDIDERIDSVKEDVRNLREEFSERIDSVKGDLDGRIDNLKEDVRNIVVAPSTYEVDRLFRAENFRSVGIVPKIIVDRIKKLIYYDGYEKPRQKI